MDLPSKYFSDKERYLLIKNLCFYRSLDNGEKGPTTEEQRHFVAVCHSQAEAETDDEKAWIKYKKLNPLAPLRSNYDAEYSPEIIKDSSVLATVRVREDHLLDIRKPEKSEVQSKIGKKKFVPKKLTAIFPVDSNQPGYTHSYSSEGNEVRKKDDLNLLSEAPIPNGVKLCIDCGVVIHSDRIKSMPYASRCLKCQESYEQIHDTRTHIDEGLPGTREAHKKMRGQLGRDMRKRNRGQ